MDFLKMDFSKLFLEKHGKSVYDEICIKIKSEAPTKYNEEYLEIIFKIAFFAYLGMDDTQIKKFLKHINNIDNVNITNIKNVHKKSIKEIQKYVKIATNHNHPFTGGLFFPYKGMYLLTT